MARPAVGTALRHLRSLLRQDLAALSDGQLLDGFRAAGDEAAFEALVVRHGPMVLGVCQRVLGNEADAEDAFQATFLVLVKKAAAVRPADMVGNFLYGVAHTTALKARALRARQAQREQEAARRPGPDPTTVALDELQAVLEKELLALPARYRAAIVLCDLEGQSLKEAAVRLGSPPGTIGTWLARGRALLARRLTRHDLTHSSALVPALLSRDLGSAGVSLRLLHTTARAAIELALGTAAPGGVSPQAVALMEGVLKTMTLSKLKTVTLAGLLVVLAVGLVARSSPKPPAVAARPALPRVIQAQGGVVRVETDTTVTLAFSPDGRLLAGGGMDKKVRVWDMRTKIEKPTLDDAKGIVRLVKFSPDGKTLVAGADDGVLYFWDTATGKLAATLRAELPRRAAKDKDDLHAAVFVNGLVFLPGGKLAVAYNYPDATRDERHTQILIWDRATKKATKLHQQEGSVYGLAVSPDGKLLAAALHGHFSGMMMWDLEKNAFVWVLKAGGPFLAAVAFSPEGKRLAVGGGHAIETRQGFRTEGRLWGYDVQTHKQLWEVEEPASGSFSTLCFTPDGKGLITGSSGPIRKYRVNGTDGEKVVSEMRRWDPATGKVLWKSEGKLASYTAVAAAPDGKTLAGCDNEQVVLIDPETGGIQKVLRETER